MRRTVRRKTFAKERIIMAASSVIVLGALTATGIWLRNDKSSKEDGYIVDLSEIENDTAGGTVGTQALKTAENAAAGNRLGDDLDYDPYFQETNSGNVENPDVSESESMSAAGSKTDEKTAEENAEETTDSSVARQKPDADKEKPGTDPSGSGQESPAPSAEGGTEGTPAIATAMQPVLSFGEDDPLVWPVVGNVLVNYSMDKTVYFPTLDQYKYNPAIVIQANEGDMITAAASGKVISVFEDPQIGKGVTMELGNGYEITYGQLEGILVSEGSYVAMGDMIAQVAAPTKYYSVEGTNVYFKLTRDGEPINPMTRLGN